MEVGGEGASACSPPPPPAAPSSLPVESQVETVFDAVAPPPPPPPPPPLHMEAEVAEAAFCSPVGDGSAMALAQLPSQGEDTGVASGTGDCEVSEEGAAALVPLLLDEEEAKEAVAPDAGGGSQEAAAATVLTDDLRKEIVRQVEYYFSDGNLPTDNFLLKYVMNNKEGFVPIALIASFRRMRKLVQDDALIVAALKTSSQLVVSLDGKKVKRSHAVPASEVEDTKPRTVLVENLPEDCSSDGIQKIFGSIGNIRNISIRDPHIRGVSGISNKGEMKISSKVHALVEYETADAAENAVVALNDEKNWRSGMRVELLLKRMEKFGIIPKGRKDACERSSNVHNSEVAAEKQNAELLPHHEEMADQEGGKHLSGAKTGQRIRNKRRGKGAQQQTGNGHGHGHVPSGSSIVAPSKPPPGPRMPDGTRGFTMGRGRPCLPSSS